MGQSISDILSIKAPCFGCQHCYNCRYWRNNVWCAWILANQECPVGKYTFSSLQEAIYLEEEKRKKEKERYIEPKKKSEWFAPKPIG